jgi:hypothetical protein
VIQVPGLAAMVQLTSALRPVIGLVLVSLQRLWLSLFSVVPGGWCDHRYVKVELAGVLNCP